MACKCTEAVAKELAAKNTKFSEAIVFSKVAHEGRAAVTSASIWFQEKIRGLPAGCVVRSATTVDPRRVPGDHVSAVLKRGVRTWAFPTPEAAEKFVKDFVNHPSR